MKNKELKIGAALSYILIFINTLYGFVLTPFILSQIGNSEFGVYKAIGSLTATMMILDFGIGSTIQRYTAKFLVDKKYENIKQFYFMSVLQGVFIVSFILIVSTGIYYSLDILYGNSFTSFELQRAKQIFVLLVASMCLHVFDRIFQGLISGHNRFIFTNTTKILSILTRTILLLTVLPVFKNSIAIVSITLFLDGIVLIASIVYIRTKLKIELKIGRWDKILFIESFKYTLALFVQSIVTQITSNSDNVIIGAIKGPELVTIYSFGLLIFGMFQSLSSSISELLLPTIMELIKKDESKHKLIRFIEKVGRFQFTLIGAAFIAFILFGKNFVILWLGEEFIDVYMITIILMIPSLWELSTNSFLAILRALNLLKFRTIILILTALINIVTTIIGVYYFGYITAAIATAISVLLNIICLNIYYCKKIKINSFKVFFKSIFVVTLCLIPPALVSIILNQVLPETWFAFVIKAVVFCLIYALMLIVFPYKQEFINIITKFKKNN